MVEKGDGVMGPAEAFCRISKGEKKGGHVPKHLEGRRGARAGGEGF